MVISAFTFIPMPETATIISLPRILVSVSIPASFLPLKYMSLGYLMVKFIENLLDNRSATSSANLSEKFEKFAGAFFGLNATDRYRFLSSELYHLRWNWPRPAVWLLAMTINGIDGWLFSASSKAWLLVLSIFSNLKICMLYFYIVKFFCKYAIYANDKGKTIHNLWASWNW